MARFYGLDYRVRMTYDSFKALCETRRSIKYYDASPVSKEDILKLLELARLAPSVENLQPWHFHVILSKEIRHKLIETSCYGNFVEGAGAFIVVTADHSRAAKAPEPLWNPKELDFSCMAAMMNIIHGATAMGLGSCWVSLHHGVAHEILSLPRNEIVVGGVMLGHYKTGEEKPSGTRDRKDLKTMYTFHE